MTVDALVFGAHPDDAELCCGGWMAKTARSVRIVDLTRGELASNGTQPIRAVEATAAASILGVGRMNLGLPDGSVAVTEEAVNAVVSVIREHTPSLVIAPWIEARHPDHAAAGRLLQRAFFLCGVRNYHPELGMPFRPSRLLHYAMRQDVRPDVVVDITEVIDVKRAAIAAHVSQVGAGEATMINGPVGLGAWDVRDRYWGATIGVHHGEPYILGAPVPVTDLVDHFEEHPSSPVLMPPR